jgi:hypothetical protein
MNTRSPEADQNLLIFADYLDTKVIQARFNLHNLVFGIPRELDEPIVNECGTQACAVGHLPLVFPKVFEYECKNPLKNHQRDKGVYFVKFIGEDIKDVDVSDLYFRWKHSRKVAAKFFEITEEDAQYLFVESHYPSGNARNPHIVADRIRDFVAGKMAPMYYKFTKGEFFPDSLNRPERH